MFYDSVKLATREPLIIHCFTVGECVCMNLLQKTMMADGSRCRRRRRCHGNEQVLRRPVVVLREPRLELCHPDDFHALRDVQVHAAVDFDAALPLVCPRRDDQTSTSVLIPFTCSCVVGCCDRGRHLPDDVIPLPVHYVAAQDDDDFDDDVDDDDDSGCSDSSRHVPSM